MRTREEFKAYVYEKAEDKKNSARRSRKIWLRSVATCSLLLIIGGAMLHGRIAINNTADECAPANATKGCAAEGDMVYGMLDVADDAAVADGGAGLSEEPESIEESEYLYASKATSCYSQSVTVALDADCVTAVPEAAEVHDFSAELKEYADARAGVVTQDFANSAYLTEGSFDVIELAKRECTAQYDGCDVDYDEGSGIYRVTFYKDGNAGGCETVYIDKNGITKLIVYGE